jgi:hypothetical protein
MGVIKKGGCLTVALLSVWGKDEGRDGELGRGDDVRHSSTGVVSTRTSTRAGVGCRRGAGHLLNV